MLLSLNDHILSTCSQWWGTLPAIPLPSFTSFFHSLCHCIRDTTLGAGQEKNLTGGKGAGTSSLSSADKPSRIHPRCIMYYHIFVTLRVSQVKKPEKPSSGYTCRSHSSLKLIAHNVTLSLLAAWAGAMPNRWISLSECSYSAWEGKPGT